MELKRRGEKKKWDKYIPWGFNKDGHKIRGENSQMFQWFAGISLEVGRREKKKPREEEKREGRGQSYS